MPKSKHRDERPRGRLDWDDVRIFAAVAAAGSVNKAATELKIMPSSVSRRLDDLETKLEVKLFHRRRTGMVLTSAGEDLYDRAQSMQRFADDIERSVRARDKRDEGQVIIAAPDGVGSLWIAPRVHDFLSRNPKIQVALDCNVGGPTVTDDDVRPDITITATESQADVGDDISFLATMHYVFLASPSYLETYGTPKSAASAMGDHRTLRQTGQITQRDKWGQRAQAIGALAQHSFESNSSSAILNALRAGAGIGTAPTYALTMAPELVQIDPTTAIPIKLWLIVHRESRNAQRVARTAEWIKSIFDTRTNPWFRDEFIPPSEFLATAEEIETRRKRR